MKRITLLVMVLLLAASTQASAKLKNAASDKDGFWRDHSTRQKVTFVGYILYDMDYFKKGQFKIMALDEYNHVKMLGRPMPEAVIEQVPGEMLTRYVRKDHVKIKEFKDNLDYVGQAVSITAVCMKKKGVKEPVFIFDSIEDFDIPQEQ